MAETRSQRGQVTCQKLHATGKWQDEIRTWISQTPGPSSSHVQALILPFILPRDLVNKLTGQKHTLINVR